MDLTQERSSAVVRRITQATLALKSARSEIEQLKSEKAGLIKRLEAMEGNFRSRMETQRVELESVKRQFEDTRSTLDGCLTTLSSNLQTYADKAKRALEEVRYENKLLADQLMVQKLKVTHLSRRMESQAKQLQRTVLVNKKLRDKKEALTLYCMRCKVRRNVIKVLGKELAEEKAEKEIFESRLNTATKEKTEVETRLQSVKGELTKSRDEVLHLRRNNAVLEQELGEEREKSAALKLEAQEAHVQHQAAVVEVGRTPTDQQQLQHQHSESSSFDSFYGSSSSHARFEQHIAQLRSQLEKMQVEYDETETERKRLFGELAFYQRRCEDMTLDLESRTLACDQKQTELDAANNQVQVLQGLLANLTAGIVTAMLE